MLNNSGNHLKFNCEEKGEQSSSMYNIAVNFCHLIALWGESFHGVKNPAFYWGDRAGLDLSAKELELWELFPLLAGFPQVLPLYDAFNDKNLHCHFHSYFTAEPIFILAEALVSQKLSTKRTELLTLQPPWSPGIYKEWEENLRRESWWGLWV